MLFSREPTAQGDEIAAYVREWYERHRESAWRRWRRREDTADEFMLGLIAEVRRVEAEARRQMKDD